MGNKSAKKSFGGENTSPTKEITPPVLVPLHLANLDCISKAKFCSVVSIFGELDDCDCWPSESCMEHAVLHFETTTQAREFMKLLEKDKVGNRLDEISKKTKKTVKLKNKVQHFTVFSIIFSLSNKRCCCLSINIFSRQK